MRQLNQIHTLIQAEAPSGVLIEDVQPTVDCGRYPVKREVGDTVVVSADIFREGHDLIAAVVQYRQHGESGWTESPMTKGDNDRWSGEFTVDVVGPTEFRVFAWPDHFESWRDELKKKVDANLDVTSELLEGFILVEETFTRASRRSASSPSAVWRRSSSARTC
jgi:starch synthase (maltosyl-transferring)